MPCNRQQQDPHSAVSRERTQERATRCNPKVSSTWVNDTLSVNLTYERNMAELAVADSETHNPQYGAPVCTHRSSMQWKKCTKVYHSCDGLVNPIIISPRAILSISPSPSRQLFNLRGLLYLRHITTKLSWSLGSSTIQLMKG